MRLRTDDDIYRARLVYLGPPEYTLPVHLPYAQYGMFVALVPLFMLGYMTALAYIVCLAVYQVGTRLMGWS